MQLTTIPRSDWVDFCQSFTQSHEGWLVTVEVATHGDRQTITEAEPLKAVSAEVEDIDGEAKVLISTGREPLERTFQTVKSVARVALDETTAGAHRGLVIESEDGSVTSLRFRAGARPETVNFSRRIGG